MTVSDAPGQPPLRATLAVVVLAGVMVLATWWLGWPAPAVVGGVIGVLASARAARAGSTPPARLAIRAALLGWGALLCWAALGGRAGGVVAMVGSLAGTRGAAAIVVAAVLVVLTLGLGGALAWAGATLVSGLLGAGTASASGRVTLSGTADVALARSAERAPAAQTP